MHIFGAMGAGDVKLFGAVGAVLGVSLVPLAFVLVVMLGAVLAVYTMLRSGQCFHDITRRLQNFCRHPARLGNATFRNAARSQTHNSLWRRDHARKLDRGCGISEVIGLLIDFRSSVGPIALATFLIEMEINHAE